MALCQHSPHHILTWVESVGLWGADDTGVVLLSREVGARVNDVRLVGRIVQPSALNFFKHWIGWEDEFNTVCMHLMK